MFHWGEYHYDALLPVKKRKADAVDERIALHKTALKEDGAKANVKQPEVPRGTSARKPPARTYRSEGERLEDDKTWWLSRAFDDYGVPLRSAEISDGVAL